MSGRIPGMKNMQVKENRQWEYSRSLKEEMSTK